MIQYIQVSKYFLSVHQSLFNLVRLNCKKLKTNKKKSNIAKSCSKIMENLNLGKITAQI